VAFQFRMNDERTHFLALTRARATSRSASTMGGSVPEWNPVSLCRRPLAPTHLDTAQNRIYSDDAVLLIVACASLIVVSRRVPRRARISTTGAIGVVAGRRPLRRPTASTAHRT